jgi:hypothetical protein
MKGFGWLALLLETPFLYTMPSWRPTGNHGFPWISQDLGSQTSLKLMVFHRFPPNLKPDSDLASKADRYTALVGCLGVPWTAWCIKRALPILGRCWGEAEALLGSQDAAGALLARAEQHLRPSENLHPTRGTNQTDINKNLQFWLSELTFEAGIGSSMAGTPLGRIFRSNGPRERLPRLCSRECSRVFPSARVWEVFGRPHLSERCPADPCQTPTRPLPGDTPGDTQGISQRLPQGIPEGIPRGIPQRVPRGPPGGTPRVISGGIPRGIPWVSPGPCLFSPRCCSLSRILCIVKKDAPAPAS